MPRESVSQPRPTATLVLPAAQPVPSTVITLRSIANFVTLEAAVYLLIFGVACMMRFWSLEARPLSSHEAENAVGAWQFLQAQGQSPVTSPLNFAADLITFMLLGATDLTARLLPALAGALIVLVPLLLRREIGRLGALLTSIILLFSPSLLYFARDVSGIEISAGSGFVAGLLLWRYLQSNQPRDLYASAAAAAFALTASAVGFTMILAAAIFIFWFRW